MSADFINKRDVGAFSANVYDGDLAVTILQRHDQWKERAKRWQVTKLKVALALNFKRMFSIEDGNPLRLANRHHLLITFVPGKLSTWVPWAPSISTLHVALLVFIGADVLEKHVLALKLRMKEQVKLLQADWKGGESDEESCLNTLMTFAGESSVLCQAVNKSLVIDSS